MPFKIKLCGIIKRIIDKYRREVAGTNLVLPVPDIAYCNRILKRIAVEVGIDKAVTYHLRRHTFATTNALVQGIRIEVVNRCRFPAGLRRSFGGSIRKVRREDHVRSSVSRMRLRALVICASTVLTEIRI